MLLIGICRLLFIRFEKSVCLQEQKYFVEFSDTASESLSNTGKVYLTNNWLINLPHWALFKEHIKEITYDKFNSRKGDRYCCFIHTADDVNYTVWLSSLEAAEKIEKWLSEK